MPKLSDAGATRKISISQIVETGNVRADYSDIEDLAASIKKNTLLEPILVKSAAPGEDEEPRYELIAGHRRVYAHKYLTEHGDDFSTIEAKIVTGDKLTIQLVENLQRADLKPREREKGIYEMSQVQGVTHREIAAELSKSEFYISRHISAYKTRKIAEEAGIDTSDLDTTVITLLQAGQEKDIPMLVQYTINGGGTAAAARAIMKDYRHPQGEAPQEANTAPPVPDVHIDEVDRETAPPDRPEMDPLAGEVPAEPEKETPPEPAAKPAPGKPAAPHTPMPRQPIDHKDVDLNDVFTEIYEYMTGLEKRIRELGPEAEQAKIDGYKKEAALDIIALVQKRFEE
jgi:ParB/RepB/Spo0J family partition protein